MTSSGARHSNLDRIASSVLGLPTMTGYPRPA